MMYKTLLLCSFISLYSAQSLSHQTLTAIMQELGLATHSHTSSNCKNKSRHSSPPHKKSSSRFTMSRSVSEEIAHRAHLHIVPIKEESENPTNNCLRARSVSNVTVSSHESQIRITQV